MSIPTLRAFSAAFANAASVNCAYPAGTAAGDYVLAMAVLNGGDKTLTGPGALTLVASWRSSTLATDAWLYLYARRIQPGDDLVTALTFTASTATKVAVIMGAFTGVNIAQPLAQAPTSTLHAAVSATLDFPSQPIAVGQLAMLLGAEVGATQGTHGSPPAGFNLSRTQYGQPASNATWMIATAPAAASGSTGAQSITNTISTKNVGATVVLNPAGDVAPVANAGPDQTLYAGSVCTLDASASFDVDVGDTLTFAWTQLSGTAHPVLSSTTAVHPTFVVPDGPDTIVWQVTATDPAGQSSTDTMTLNAIAAPLTPTQLAGTLVAPAGTRQIEILAKVVAPIAGERHFLDDLDLTQ